MAVRMRALLLSFLALAGLACAAAARADSWSPPEPETYVSLDGATRLKIVPRSPSSNLRYFEDLVAGRRPAGQRPGETMSSAQGQIERRGADGRWIVQWRGPLVNEVAPVSALVANDGRHFVTFDNWHFVGHGDQAIVIYSAEGQVIRALALTDFLPADYVEALPRTVSSLHWSGEHRLAAGGATLILSIRIPAEQEFTSETRYVELEVDLASGRPAPLAGPAWERALAETARVRQLQREGAARYERFMTEPLSPPVGAADERAWHNYASEAFFRIDPDWPEGSAHIFVLRRPDADDYRISRESLRATLREEPYEGRSIMLASPAPDGLAQALAEEVGQLRPGALRRVTVYVVAGDSLWPRIVEIFARSGATLIQVDPAEPIPQRRQRMPGYQP